VLSPVAGKDSSNSTGKDEVIVAAAVVDIVE
jgi:hypothetical protein